MITLLKAVTNLLRLDTKKKRYLALHNKSLQVLIFYLQSTVHRRKNLRKL